MRIIKEWNTHAWKYTMFYHNNRYTLKVENGSTEQVFKLGDLSNDPSTKIQKISSDKRFQQQFEIIFGAQENLKLDILGSLGTSVDEDEFDDII